jgi:hypothetical protein
MKNLELSVDQNLFGQIDFNAVKIALEKDEMEEIVGGYSSNRACMLMGGLTILAFAFGGAAGIGAAMYTISECA